MTILSKLGPTPQRRAWAAAMLGFILLTAACEYKRAMPAPRASHRISYFMEPRSGFSDVSLSIDKASVNEDSAPQAAPPITDRKVIRNGSLDLLVNDVAQSVERIGQIVTGFGGYVEKSTQSNSGGHQASLTLRVPAAKLDQTISECKKLATTVDRENVEVRDVTREYIDLDARLRNAQAEEAAYLQILKRATTIKDTLDVTEKLSNVRGRIEQMQGEMKFLTAQIDMSSLEVTIRAEADSTVAGIHWRPLRQAKIAVNDMLSGLADWADSVVAFFIYLPLIVLWLLSAFILLLVAWRTLRFLWRKFGPKITWRLPWRRPAPPTEPKSA